MNPPPTTAPDRAPTPAERKALALQRLEASRTLLIQRLYPQPAGGSRPQGGGPRADTGPLLALLLSRIERKGGARGVWRAARSLARRWWGRQPWHTSAELVVRTVAQEARPVVQHHPWASLAAAAALGGALLWASPWLMRTVRQQTRDWRAGASQLLWQQLAQAPVQLALAGALSAWLTELGRRQPPQEPTPRPQPPDVGP